MTLHRKRMPSIGARKPQRKESYHAKRAIDQPPRDGNATQGPKDDRHRNHQGTQASVLQLVSVKRDAWQPLSLGFC